MFNFGRDSALDPAGGALSRVANKTYGAETEMLESRD